MKNFLKGIFAGLAIGAVAGVLLAPKSGKETRTDIRKVYSSILNDVREKLLAIQDLSEEKYADIIDNVVTEYHNAKKISKKQVEEITNLLREKWEQVKDPK